MNQQPRMGSREAKPPAQRMDRRIDLSVLPVRRVESGYKIGGTILGLVGALLVLGSLGILFGEFSPWGLLTPLTWVGMAIFLGGVHLAIMGKEVTLDAERVAVRSRGVLGRKAWSEALSAYPGVLLRSQWETGGQNQHSYQVFLVELPQTDPKKTVVLFHSRRDAGWHATWRDVSLRLHLPALEQTPDGVVTHSPEELEKSIRERFQGGALEVAFDPSAPPPPGLAVQAEAGGLDIRVLQRNWRSPALWAGVTFIFLGLILSIILMAYEIPAVFVWLLGGGFTLAAIGHVGAFLLFRPRLRIGQDRIGTSWISPLGEGLRKEIDPARIIGVQIGAPKGQQSGLALHILTDDGRTYFGTGLSRPALEWLRGCLIAALARL